MPDYYSQSYSGEDVIIWGITILVLVIVWFAVRWAWEKRNESFKINYTLPGRLHLIVQRGLVYFTLQAFGKRFHFNRPRVDMFDLTPFAKVPGR